MPKEKVLWEGAPKLAAFYGFYVAGGLALALTAFAAVKLGLPLWAWDVVIPFSSAMFTLPLLLQQAWQFTVTDRVARSEFNLWVRRVREAPLRNVTDMAVNQGFIDRLLKFGEVRLDTAGTSFPGVSFWGVDEPMKVVNAIKLHFIATQAGPKKG